MNSKLLTSFQLPNNNFNPKLLTHLIDLVETKTLTISLHKKNSKTRLYYEQNTSVRTMFG
jgi:hypothetical protein